METKPLDYFKDKDDNYIIRRCFTNEPEQSYFNFAGTYSAIFIFKQDGMEQHIDDMFQKISNQIEENALKKYKITKESFLFEKIIGNFVDEKKYNPLFSKMTEEEALAFVKDTKKVKINIAFEIHIKVEKHLKLLALKEFLFGNKNNENPQF